MYGRNAHTNLLQIPEYPFYFIVGFGFLAYALILLPLPRIARRAAEPTRISPTLAGNIG